MSVLGNSLRALRNLPKGTASVRWWGHPSPEAPTKLQHLKNAAFHLQEVWQLLKDHDPSSKLPPGLDHRCSCPHPAILGSAGSWKPGYQWEGAIPPENSRGKGHLHSGANAVTGSIQPEEQKPGARKLKSSHCARPFCQGLIHSVRLQEEPRLVPFPTYFSQ